MDHNKIICVYCKRNAELMTSNNTTTVICSHCGTATGLETYKELFDNWVYEKTKKVDE
jgi:hypothetical protein